MWNSSHHGGEFQVQLHNNNATESENESMWTSDLFLIEYFKVQFGCFFYKVNHMDVKFGIFKHV